MASIVLRQGVNILNRSFRYATRGIMSSTKIGNDHRVVASSDGQTVVCWHPEIEFPYEHSLPVNVEQRKSVSVLKVQHLKEVLSVLEPQKEEFMRQELMNLTYTTMHRWFPEGVHKRRRKRPVERSRPYL